MYKEIETHIVLGVLFFLIIFSIIFIILEKTKIPAKQRKVANFTVSFIAVAIYIFIVAFLSIVGIELNIIPAVKLMIGILIFYLFVIIYIGRQSRGLQIMYIVFFVLGIISTIMWSLGLFAKILISVGILTEISEAWVVDTFIFSKIIVILISGLFALIVAQLVWSGKLLKVLTTIFSFLK